MTPAAQALVTDPLPVVELDALARLRPATQRWYERVLRTWQLDGHHEMLLLAACQCWDTAQAAREAVDADGIVLLGADGAAGASRRGHCDGGPGAVCRVARPPRPR